MIIANYITKIIPCDPIKLQILIYYVQAVSLVKRGKPVFTETIEAGEYGPLIRSIYNEYPRLDIIRNTDESYQIDIEILACIDLVIGHYGKMSGAQLIQEVCSESPWIEAYKTGSIITQDSIKDYYSKIYTFE